MSTDDTNPVADVQNSADFDEVEALARGVVQWLEKAGERETADDLVADLVNVHDMLRAALRVNARLLTEAKETALKLEKP